MITPEWVKQKVEEVRAAANEEGDNENAHQKEDGLHIAVLEAIAKGEAEDPKLCAYLALTTLEIDYTRWFA